MIDQSYGTAHKTKTSTKLQHWRIQGGAAGACPQGSRFFCFDIQIFRNVAASGVGAPLREILDPPLYSFFQYKVSSYIVTTNVKRAKWDPSVSSLCTFCKRVSETTLHVIHKCQDIRKVWRALESWLLKKVKVKVTLYPYEVILINTKVQGRRQSMQQLLFSNITSMRLNV